jgi:hypothetical protein
MRRAITALCACALLGGGIEMAAGHTNSTATTVAFMGTEREPDDTYRAFGDLLTTKKCRVDRKVKIFYEYVTGARQQGPAPPDWTLVDIDRSSRNGMWGGSGPIGGEVGGVGAVKIRATRKNVGPPGHRHICRADTQIRPLA